jgi:type VI secretion system protein
MTLFGEIARGESYSTQESIRALRAEIIAHLERLCAIRRGALLLAPNYGVHDVTLLFHSFPGGMDDWCAELSESLATYEPRLRNVRVTPIVGERLELTFRVTIEGSLVSNGRVTPVQFSATLDPHRSWSVK